MEFGHKLGVVVLGLIFLYILKMLAYVSYPKDLNK